MKIMLNDLSFHYTMSSTGEALEALEQFAQLCSTIEKNGREHIYTALEGRLVTAPDGDYSGNIAPETTVYQLAGQIRNRELRSYFLSLLKNRETPVDRELPFCMDGKASYLCGRACEENGLVISLRSALPFEESRLNGTYKQKPYALGNISSKEHCEEYWEALGRRIYRPNNRKHKPDRNNFYGGSAPASPMDLDDAESQKLLNLAVFAGGRLYARRNNKNYAFQQESPGVYHGYIAENLSDGILKTLEECRERWKR